MHEHACVLSETCLSVQTHVCDSANQHANAQNIASRKISQTHGHACADRCMYAKTCMLHHIRIYQGAQNKRAARIRTFKSASTHGEMDLPLRTRIDQPVNPYPAIESSTIIGQEPLQRLHGKMRRTCTAQHV